MDINVEQMIDTGREVLEQEALALQNLSTKLDVSFIQACSIILKCKARVVITGVGKSAHIGRKIAATFASTGTPAIFVHAGEANHGDMGMFTRDDIALAISYSGEAEEIKNIIPLVKGLKIPLISITGSKDSTLARSSNIHLNIGKVKEACRLGLAPTTSTTLTLALGDALAVAILESRGFTKKDFAFSHPGGQLGRRLLLKVKDIMQKGDYVPIVKSTATLKEALYEISKKFLGMTIIASEELEVLGIFTDGDLRRYLEKNSDLETPIVEIMNKRVTTVPENFLAADALKMMQDKKINSFPVVNKNNKIVGAFNFHHLLSAKII